MLGLEAPFAFRPRVFLRPRPAGAAAALILLACWGGLPPGRRAAFAAEPAGIGVAQEGPVRGADAREVFSWIDDALRIQPATVARFQAMVGAPFQRIERNGWIAVYETSGSSRPWIRRTELRLPERADEGWSSFLILDLDPARVEVLPSEAIGYRPGARVGLNPPIPPGWREIGKYWQASAPDFLVWEGSDATIVFRFRSEGPRKLAQCSLYRRPAASSPAGANARRVGKSRLLRAETGLGPAIDSLLDQSPDAVAQVQSLQAAGWRLIWSPWMISAVDLVQKAILLPKDKNPRKAYGWLLWELTQIPRPEGAFATRPGG